MPSPSSTRARDRLTFAAFYHQTLDLAFHESAPVRIQNEHRGGALTPVCSSPRNACHGCTERVYDLMLSLWSSVQERLSEPDFDLVRYVRAAAAGRAYGLDQEAASDAGMVCKVDRTIDTTLWIAQVVPERHEHELLRAMLHFVRTDDPGDPWPVERMATNLGIGAEEVTRLLEEIPARIASLSASRADWVRRNLTQPLARKQDRSGALSLDALGPIDLTARAADQPVEDALFHEVPEGDETTDQRMGRMGLIDRLATAARRLRAEGFDDTEAVRRSAADVLHPDQAASLLAAPDLVELAHHLLA